MTAVLLTVALAAALAALVVATVKPWHRPPVLTVTLTVDTRPFSEAMARAAAVSILPSTRAMFAGVVRLEEFRMKCRIVGANPEPLIDRAKALSLRSPARHDPFWALLDREFSLWLTERSRPSDRNPFPRFHLFRRNPQEPSL